MEIKNIRQTGNVYNVYVSKKTSQTYEPSSFAGEALGLTNFNNLISVPTSEGLGEIQLTDIFKPANEEDNIFVTNSDWMVSNFLAENVDISAAVEQKQELGGDFTIDDLKNIPQQCPINSFNTNTDYIEFPNYVTNNTTTDISFELFNKFQLANTCEGNYDSYINLLIENVDTTTTQVNLIPQSNADISNMVLLFNTALLSKETPIYIAYNDITVNIYLA